MTIDSEALFAPMHFSWLQPTCHSEPPLKSIISLQQERPKAPCRHSLETQQLRDHQSVAEKSSKVPSALLTIAAPNLDCPEKVLGTIACCTLLASFPTLAHRRQALFIIQYITGRQNRYALFLSSTAVKINSFVRDLKK